MVQSPEWEVFQAFLTKQIENQKDSLATRNPLTVEGQAEMLKTQGHIACLAKIKSEKLIEEGGELMRFAAKYTNDRPPDRRI